MRHARALLESRPYLSRIPLPRLVPNSHGGGAGHIAVCCDDEGSYVFVYSPLGESFDVNIEDAFGYAVPDAAVEEIRASWFDPRTGKMEEDERFRLSEFGWRRTFTPPTNGPGNDWVLVLDDVARDFPLL